MEIDHFPSRYQRLLLEANPMLCRAGAAATSNRSAGVLRVRNRAKPTQVNFHPGSALQDTRHILLWKFHARTKSLILRLFPKQTDSVVNRS
jgi:hypothetical protein